MMYRLNLIGVSVAITMLTVLPGKLLANSVPILELQDQVVNLGNELSFVVAPKDVDGVAPSVFVRSGPAEATLSDNGDGTKTFSWQPTRAGNYTVNFIVQDGANASLANQYAYDIKVVANVARDDGIGMVPAKVAVRAVGTPVNMTGVAILNPGGASAADAFVDSAVQSSGSSATQPIVNTEVEALIPTSEPNVAVDTTGEGTVPTVGDVIEPGDKPVTLQANNSAVVPADVAETPLAGEINAAAALTSTANTDTSDQSIFLSNEVGAVTKILTDLPVSTSQTNVLQSSVDSSGRYLYTANIEVGPNGDAEGVPLRTVLRQGYQRSDNTWEWKSVIIDDRTLHDRWHTAPSVAVDKLGDIHVAYNMHNFPWQYKKSDRAHDITSMVFKGQQITDAELALAAAQNQTNFPTLGSAAIPGNQISYPTFYKDKNNDLHIAYRFAVAPQRPFFERMMSTGIAKYDAGSRTWSSIGAKNESREGDFIADLASPNVAIPFAGKRGWTSYLPRVVFSKQNNMIVSLFWRSGIAGRQVVMPCVVRSISSKDVVDMKGGPLSLPVTPELCGNIGIANSKEFYSIGSFAIDNEDNPYLLLSPTEGSRFFSRYSVAQQRWIEEKVPEGATEIFFDNDNNMYAIASGIKIFKRSSVSANWQSIYAEKTTKNCYPKVKMDESGNNAFIHTQSCDEKHVTIYGLRLP